MNQYKNARDYITQNELKYHIVTYGCQMNAHESEKIAGMLQSLGYSYEEDSKKADIIVFNTCCIRDNAEQKTFGNVGALKQQKLENKELLIAVCGCMTQQEDVAKKLYRTFPFVDIVLGTHNIVQLPELVEKRIESGKKSLEISFNDDVIEEGIPVLRGTGPLASVNVMYGCNNYCSYCIVPYVRGKERSRSIENIICEVDELVLEGYNEVMLLGQNVNSYQDHETGFAGLLSAICERTKIKRVRFMTSHPKDLSNELIEVMARYRQICNHIHLPVQSGSTKILAAMNRKYTREQYLELVQKIRTAIPDITITTDIIVGFPGEREEDFAQTMSLLEQVQFDAAFTFVYSKRTGTKAALMPDMVEPDTATRRIVELIALQNSITEKKNMQCVGKEYVVLVQGISTRNEQHVTGRTEGNRTVNFVGTPDMVGAFYKIKITEGKKTTLFGEIVERVQE